MSADMVDAEVVEYKFIGSNFVIIRLPDGWECKFQIEPRVFKVKDQKNPDGTPQYAAPCNVLTSWKAPAGYKLKVPRPPVPVQNAKPPDQRLAQ